MQMVKEQYDKFPYPRISWLAQLKPSSTAHATYETGASLIHRKFQLHENKKIALLGCGTTEPAAFAVAHPNTRITALDFSAGSIKQAQRFCRLHFKNNVDFHTQDLLDFCSENEAHFDYVHCFGVLHHLPQPQKGFAALKHILKKDGFARIMVYSSESRRHIQKIQSLVKILGMQEPAELSSFMKTLPLSHPLRLCFEMHPEKNNPQGFIDAFMHACEQGFTFNELEKVLKENGLYLHHWDFSENIKRLLFQAPLGSIEEKINWLSISNQWPAPFTFWVAPFQKTEKTNSHVIRNPLIKWRFKTSLYSPLIRRTLEITKNHRQCFALCNETQVSKKLIPLDCYEALNELIEARFILEVQP
jgi:SAM-dependent methyltransferase